MSRFFQRADLTPYVPGEQPKGGVLIKLNTNESPFPPPEEALHYAAEHARSPELYCDTDATALRQALAARHGLQVEEIMVSNGSDEALDLAFQAFCSRQVPAVFPDITYGFYRVFADVNRVPATIIPLREDFTMDVEALRQAEGTLFLANPNAPTGISLERGAIEALLRANPDRVIVVDEAYVDFGGESCVPLIHRYDNLLVTQTFSKSRSLAGARLGVAMGQAALIRDLNTLRFSHNPYNVSAYTQALGEAMLLQEATVRSRCRRIAAIREDTAQRLTALGFRVLPSSANFLFAAHEAISGGDLQAALRQRGILVRHFDGPRTAAFNRITIGTEKQMAALIAAVTDILNQP